MFPYLEQPAVAVGPFTIHGFGVLAAAGIVAGYFVAVRRVRVNGLDPATGSALVMWMVIAGLAGSHLAALALAGPRALLSGGMALLRVGDGMSSFGGLLAGALAGVWFLGRRGVGGRETRAYFDAVAYAFPVAWLFGRAGCSIAHDHPGIRTASFLAVRYPDGPRYDAGLLELLAFVPIVLLFLALGRRRPGFYVALLFVIYGPVRFLIDSIRIEPRYLHLTVGQYASIATLVVGLVLLIEPARKTRQDAGPSEPRRARVAP